MVSPIYPCQTTQERGTEIYFMSRSIFFKFAYFLKDPCSLVEHSLAKTDIFFLRILQRDSISSSSSSRFSLIFRALALYLRVSANYVRQIVLCTRAKYNFTCTQFVRRTMQWLQRRFKNQAIPKTKVPTTVYLAKMQKKTLVNISPQQQHAMSECSVP
jgi:hypothetical protein